MDVSHTIIQAIKQHASVEYPKEACGLIVNNEYKPCINEHPNPTEQFKINNNVYLESQMSGGLQAVIHSHCYTTTPHRWDPRWPTSHDMKSWMATGIPWGIVATNDRRETSNMIWLDDSDIKPLIGREFIHGVHDCYSLVRDYFRLNLNITLPNYPRGMEWWQRGDDLYSQNFKDAGFREITRYEATVNDCCLFKVASPVINHAAVITGPNEILHHLIHRLSGHDTLNKWERHIVKYVRYTHA